LCESRANKAIAGESEVEDEVESGLEIVLGLVEEGGINPVCFEAHGKPRMQAVIQANTGLRGKRAAAVARRLGLQVCATHQGVHPGLESVAASTNADSSATTEILHMLIDVNRGSEAGDDVALDGEPAIRKVADRGVGANEAGVDDVGLEAVKTDANSQLPAVIVAISINKIGFGGRSSGNRSGLGSGRRRGIRAARVADSGVDQVDLSGAGVAEGGGDILRAAFDGRGDARLLRADCTRRRQDDRHSQDWLLHTDCPPPLVTAPPRRRGAKLPGQRIITRPPGKVSQRSCAAKPRRTR